MKKNMRVKQYGYMCFNIFIIPFIYFILQLLVESNPVAHILGILWVLLGVVTASYGMMVGKSNRDMNPYDSITSFTLSIIIMIEGFGLIYSVGDFLPGESVLGVFWNAMYFSTVTWTTLGYGDIQPNGVFKLVAAIEALAGYIFMAILVGRILHQASRKGII